MTEADQRHLARLNTMTRAARTKAGRTKCAVRVESIAAELEAIHSLLIEAERRSYRLACASPTPSENP